MYKLHKNILDVVDMVVCTTDGACIPFDSANVDFQEYQKWLSEGNQPLPADEPNA